MTHPMTRDVGGGSRPVPDPTVLTTEQLNRAIESLRELLESKINTLFEVADVRHSSRDQMFQLMLTSHDERDFDQHSEIRALRDADDRRFMEHLDRNETMILNNGKRIDDVPNLIAGQVQSLKTFMLESFRVVEEKFAGVEKQFAERDTRVRDVAASGAAALSAALQAAKEAVGEANKSFSLSIDKSEKATLEQINQQRLLLETRTKALDDQISDLKDRMTRTEADQRAAALALGTAVAEKSGVRGQGNWFVGILIAIAIAGIDTILTLFQLFGSSHH